MDRVTVVIPAFNAESTIARAVGSASELGVRQIIVVDDGSLDHTVEIAEIANAHVIRQPNMGAAVARRSGLDAVDSELVILLDADDKLLPAIVQAARIALQDSKIGVVGGRYRFYRGPDRKTVPGPATQDVYSLPELLKVGRSPWPPCAAVWRMSAISQARTMSPSAIEPRYAEDYELLLRVAHSSTVIGIDEFTAVYSLDGGKSSTSAQNALKCARTLRDYYATHANIPILPISDREIRQTAAWRTFRGKQIQVSFATAVGWALRHPANSVDVVGAALARIRQRFGPLRRNLPDNTNPTVA